MDGGQLENVSISNITMKGCMTPIFVRLGARNARQGEGRSYLRNVRLENIKGSSSSRIACSITGVPGLRPESILLKNIDLSFPGGGSQKEAKQPVPEKEQNYPDCRMFNSKALPAYGFYVRHADRVSFENVRLSYRDRFEAREPIVIDDADVHIAKSCSFQSPAPK